MYRREERLLRCHIAADLNNAKREHKENRNRQREFDRRSASSVFDKTAEER
jgi:hypothetical protein